jgi:hypothetical protein
MNAAIYYLVGLLTGATLMEAIEELFRGQYSSAAWEIGGIAFFNLLVFMASGVRSKAR